MLTARPYCSRCSVFKDRCFRSPPTSARPLGFRLAFLSPPASPRRAFPSKGRGFYACVRRVSSPLSFFLSSHLFEACLQGLFVEGARQIRLPGEGVKQPPSFSREPPETGPFLRDS